MKRIKVSVGAGGRVNIRLKKDGTTSNVPNFPLREKISEPIIGEPSPQKIVKPDKVSPSGNGLTISPSLVELMELRAESAFRPNEKDVEIVYALTGLDPNMPDLLHKFSSNEIVARATPNNISYYTDTIIKHILEERGEKPKLLIKLHTHPDGSSQLSEMDKESNKSVSKQFKEAFPGVAVYFGVHSISKEAARMKRISPSKESNNTLKWSSITRKHEVAFYTEDSKPKEVAYNG